MHLFMNDVLAGSFDVRCCDLMMFYDWHECVISICLAPENIPSAIVYATHLAIQLYCIVLQKKTTVLDQRRERFISTQVHLTVQLPL